jgi:hypothetical protein
MSDALDLLDEARRTLRDDLAPRLEGEARYLALLAANAVATARRALAVAAPLAAAEAAVEADPAEIRAGARDDDAALVRRLLAAATLRAWVADPSALTEAETRALPPEAAS